ncbi:MAG: hypothetical protein ABI823_01765 [Bryobacteraceae bacterium]
MRFLVICLLSLFLAASLPAEQKAPKIKGAKYQKHKFKKPGKYKRPKLQAQKWKPTKEQREAAKRSQRKGK